MRSYQAILAGESAADAAQATSEVGQLPPGYITGLLISVANGTRLDVGPGRANVWGSIVSHDETTSVEESSWLVTRNVSTKYYLYLTRSGDYAVDIVAPQYVARGDGDYHPDLQHRYLGAFYVSSANRIVFSLAYKYTNPEIITVAAKGYTGYANYYCKGVRDEVEWNDAISYVSQSINVGKVAALGETFVLSSDIEWASNVDGEGGQSVFTGITTFSTLVAFIYLNGISNVTLSGFKFDTSNGATPLAHIWGVACIGLNVKGCTCTDLLQVAMTAIRIDGEADSAIIADCVIRNSHGYGIDIQGNGWTVTRNYFSGSGLTSISVTPQPAIMVTGSRNTITDNTITAWRYRIGVISVTSTAGGGATDNMVTGNRVKDCIANRSNIASAYVVIVSGLLSANRGSVIQGNHVKDCYIVSGVATTEMPAYYVGSAERDDRVAGNVALDNGNLIDRANCASNTAPLIRGQTAGASSNCSFAISTAEAYDETNSYLFTKTAAAGTAGRFYLHSWTSATAGQMGSMVAGLTYRMRWYFRIPSAGASANSCFIGIGWIPGTSTTWTTRLMSAAVTYDAWQGVSVTASVAANATAFMAFIGMSASSTLNATFFVDHGRVNSMGMDNEHSQSFVDSGTSTRESGNSWSSPFEP